MIIHFVIDGKLTDQIIENFLEVSENNFFLVFGMKDHDQTFSRITRTGHFINTFNEHRDDINQIINALNAKAIVLHSLSLEYAKTILRIRGGIPICWIIWGYDVYGLPKINPGIYAPLTNRFLLKNDPFIHIKRNLNKNNVLRRFFNEKIKAGVDSFGIVFKAMNRINFAATFIDEDFNTLQDYYPNNICFIRSAFSTINQYLAGEKSLYILPDAENILLGNSNAPSSNYLDAISLLSRNINQLKKVYVVLSYGSDDLHKKEILLNGRKLLHNHFYPLLDFVARKEYINVLRTCSVGIFNHYRQRAMGNIIAMLYMGSRVYLSKKNPSFKFFTKNGIIVNSIEKDLEIYGTSKQTSDIVEINRKNLDKIFKQEKVTQDLKNLIEVITGNQCH